MRTQLVLLKIVLKLIDGSVKRNFFIDALSFQVLSEMYFFRVALVGVALDEINQNSQHISLRSLDIYSKIRVNVSRIWFKVRLMF